MKYLVALILYNILWVLSIALITNNYIALFIYFIGLYIDIALINKVFKSYFDKWI